MNKYENDYLEEYRELISIEKINLVRNDRQKWLDRKSSDPFRQAVESLPSFKSSFVDLSGDAITIGRKEELSEKEYAQLLDSIKILIPWRKGPFNLFDHYIDSEWKSNLKWQRVLPHVDDLREKIVADIGCNNGYYMFKMAEQKPKLVIGFDPMPRFYFSFNLVNRFTRFSNLKYEMLGAEHIDYFHNLFDAVFCMGVLYHSRNPIQVLCGIWKSMKPGGQLIIDNQGIPGNGSHALFPEERYAKARNVWFVPTADCLSNWIKRAGFKEVECFSIDETTSNEQRTTDYAPWESLNDFLDPKDRSKTVEGYPAPVRICIKARKLKN